MSERSILGALALTFGPLSLVTVGGGQAVVSDIHRQVVEVHGWLGEAAFVNAFAVSRMAPGPGTLLVTLIGWEVAGGWGALVATLAIFGPTAILVWAIARAWHRRRGARWQRALEAGLRPVAAGMILASVYVLFEALEGGWVARGVALASTAILMASSAVSPLLLIGGGALVLLGATALGLA